MKSDFLIVDPRKDLDVIRGLASKTRSDILYLLLRRAPINVNEIAAVLDLPQSTVATNVQALEKAGLIETVTTKATKGNQKICRPRYREIVIRFADDAGGAQNDNVEVSMPIGLFTAYEISPPCGLCTEQQIIGSLDVPHAFLDPQRMQAELLWFALGYVEYKFPNNVLVLKRKVRRLEISMELSSEKPGTDEHWPSDITVWLNGHDLGLWTSPGDHGDRRGVNTPSWWKLKGSQYGHLKTWVVDSTGTSVDGARVSDVTLEDLDLASHHSIRVRIGIAPDAAHPGGINIFGKKFGDYSQDIVLKLCF